MFEGDRRFDIVVRLPEAARVDLEALQNLPVALPRATADAAQRSLLLSQLAAVPVCRKGRTRSAARTACAASL